jgi:hypothetical protein
VNYFRNIGFEEDPFAHTNADQETERLPDYFVKPPYFDAVFGDPYKPSSFVVFAPRGGGKTSQRLMIENECKKNNVLAITYDKFEFHDVESINDITLKHHLVKIIQNCLWAILATIHEEPNLNTILSKHDKNNLSKLSEYYLSTISDSIIEDSISSLRSISEKIRAFWNNYLPIINAGVRAILGRLGINVDNVNEFKQDALNYRTSPKSDFRTISRIVKILGYNSTYILIDKVDETDLTSRDARSAFKLIQPILQDLELLELEGVGFKLFLWDQLEPLYQEIARTDRIKQESLEWTQATLSDMWMKRLRAYSHRRISQLAQISESLTSHTIDEMILIFAHYSPRDAIRIGNQIISEQRELDAASRKLTRDAILRAIEKFCLQKAKEMITPKTLQDLRRINSVDFTIPYLANIIFREKQTSTRGRIFKWKTESAIVDVDRVDEPESLNGVKVKLFALDDIRVAKEVCKDLDVITFLNQKYRLCAACSTAVLRDWGEINSTSLCHNCQYDVIGKQSSDNNDVWRYSSRASERRNHRKKEQLDIRQMSFADYLDYKNKTGENDWDELEDDGQKS